jgi:hypothetical protein
MTNKKSDAAKYRLRQAQKLLDLFEDANGRPAKDGDELSAWFASPEGRKAIAYDCDKEGKIIPDCWCGSEHHDG